MSDQTVEKAYNYFLSPEVKHRSERIILWVAIISYLIHLLLILLANQGVIPLEANFFQNPIAAIYTPFTFILVFEVYLLIFYLPKSISVYIGKQYEIITLIVIRRIFKDIANLELTSQWFRSQSDLQFTYDVITSLVLFVIIYFFYQWIRRSQKKVERSPSQKKNIQRFIKLKKALAALLVPILIVLAIYTLINWSVAVMSDYKDGVYAFKKINNVFFDEFFTVLIIVDVLLLLASFFYSNKFHKIIRNSGFVISTVLIKVSFSVEGIVNNALIIGAVLFGFLILIIHNLFEKNPVIGED